MYIRKIQLVGNRSYSISLPKKWIESNNLKEQDSVTITINSNKELLISPNKKELEEDKLLKIKVENLSFLKQLIYLCYLKNIKKVNLVADNFNYEDRKKLRKVIFHLEGYTILNETDKNIELYLSSISQDHNIMKIIKRMLYILEDSIDALIKKDLELAEQNENELDIFYHLAKKLLIQMNTDFTLREENEIIGFEDLFFLFAILKKVENFGDLLYGLKFKKTKKEDLITVKKYVDYLVDVFIYNKDVKEFYDFLSKNENKFEAQSFSCVSKIYNICFDILNNKVALDLNKKIFGK